MTEKRFVVEYLEYEPYYIDKEQEYIDTDEKELKFNDLITMSDKQVVECLNHLHEENMCLKGEVAHYKLILMSLEEEAKRITENWKVRK